MTIDVQGGSGGLAVALDDLTAAARVLLAEADAMGGLALRLVAMAPSPELVRIALAATLPAFGPRHGAEVLRAAAGAEWLLLRAAGPGGAAGRELSLGSLAAVVQASVEGYRSAEAGVSASMSLGRQVVMAAAGAAWPVGLAAALGLGAEAVVGELLGTADPLFEHPWLVDVVSGGLPGLAWGLTLSDPRLLALGAVAALASGRPWPPGDYGSAVGAATGAASLGGLLRESGTVRVTPVPSPAASSAPSSAAPKGLASLLRAQDELSAMPARVRVVEIPRRDGTSAWIVQLPGTQEWRPVAGANPLDLTSDVRLMAGRSALLTRGAAQALDAAMAASGRAGAPDPVMLTGHSLGGIAAASMACDAEFTRTHRVTHVVTAGSPVARFPVPPEVSVLSLEHRQDAVPRLDGERNPDRASWVTVTRDVARDRDVSGRLGVAHEVREYAETAEEVDAAVREGTDASLSDWAAGSREFFASGAEGPAVVRDYAVTRIGEHGR